MIGDRLHLLFQKQKTSQTGRATSQATGGFTIVETLIVLAITGVMFVSIIALVSGRQNKTRFVQAANSIQSEIEQIIGEVQSGYSPDTQKFSCAADPVVRTDQGGNSKCISLGKVLQFDTDKYYVYSLAGNKYSSIRTAYPSQSFQDAQPRVRDDATLTTGLKYGLTKEWMRLNGANIGSVAFVPYFAGNDEGLVYGSQSTQIVPIGGGLGATAINNNIVAAYADKNPQNGVQVCFRSGGTEQSALVTIGGSKRMNSVTLAIKNTIDCSG
jgi:type II secretory pathway pseudopilin PulG